MHPILKHKIVCSFFLTPLSSLSFLLSLSHSELFGAERHVFLPLSFQEKCSSFHRSPFQKNRLEIVSGKDPVTIKLRLRLPQVFRDKL